MLNPYQNFSSGFNPQTNDVLAQNKLASMNMHINQQASAAGLSPAEYMKRQNNPQVIIRKK